MSRMEQCGGSSMRIISCAALCVSSGGLYTSRRLSGTPVATGSYGDTMIRELQPSFDEGLLEPEATATIGKLRLQLPKLNKLTFSSPEDYKAFVRPAAEIVFGAGLIWFGAGFAGSAFLQATHFSGVLATIFYTYQAGTIMMIAGGICFYDGLKQTGYV